MSLNMSSARTYNKDRKYSVNAIWAIQRRLGISTSGVFDDATLRAIYDWQGSPDRLTKLTKDGKLGPKGLGCMIAEMRQGAMSTDTALLAAYPHTLPGGSGAGTGTVVSSFIVTNPVSLDLRADGAGWQFRGRFRVDIRLNPALSNPGRYQYRQFIKGKATSTPGRFAHGAPKTLANWSATGPVVDHASQFKVPGGLSATTYREDGITDGGSVRRFGYRSSAAHVAVGEEDRYLPTQATGSDYVCVDTYGVMGSNRVTGTRLTLELHYKGVIVDVQQGLDIVMEKAWSYKGDDIFAV